MSSFSNFIVDFFKKKLFFLYQPIYDINNNIMSFEVLSRLKYQNRVYSPISFFTEINSKHHNIITKYIIRNNKKIVDKLPVKQLNINLNYYELEDEELMELLIENKNNINVECLENTSYKNYTKQLRILKENGVCIYLDDFGNNSNMLNYFSDVYCSNFFDVVKIDGQFIQSLYSQGKNIKNILRLKKIIELIKLDDKKIVVEYVSNKNIYDIVKKLDIDMFQGFYLSKPLTLKEIINKF